MRAAGMTDSQTEQTPSPPPGRRLEFPILELFPKLGAAFRASPVNAAVIAVCVAIFLVLNLGGEPLQSTALQMLAPSPLAIWTGSLWGLVTSAFVHLAICRGSLAPADAPTSSDAAEGWIAHAVAAVFQVAAETAQEARIRIHAAVGGQHRVTPP